MGNFSYTQLFGLLIIINAMLVSAWLLTSTQISRWLLFTFFGFGIFAGIVVLLSHRITELKIPGIGGLQAAAEQAVIDAKTISDIKNRVESQSATVDLVARSAEEAKELAEDASKAYEHVKKKVAELDATTQNAEKIIKEISVLQKLMITIMSAQNDDRNAFDILETYLDDGNVIFRKIARNAWHTIFESHSEPFSREYKGVFLKEYAPNPAELDIHQLYEIYNKRDSYEKPNYLAYVWKRKDIPQIDRLDFMIKVIETDDSLTAVEYAGRYFISGTKAPIRHFAVKFILKWWQDNREKFVNNS